MYHRKVCLGNQSTLSKPFTGKKLDYPDDFGGLRWNGNYTLMQGGDSPGYWFFLVGIIWEQDRPYYLGPRGVLNVEEVQLFIKKDC